MTVFILYMLFILLLLTCRILYFKMNSTKAEKQTLFTKLQMNWLYIIYIELMVLGSTVIFAGYTNVSAIHAYFNYVYQDNLILICDECIVVTAWLWEHHHD